MPYILKQYDTALMTFDLQRDFDGFHAAALHIEPGARCKLPLDLQNPDGGSLLRWLKNRAVPAEQGLRAELSRAAGTQRARPQRHYRHL